MIHGIGISSVTPPQVSRSEYNHQTKATSHTAIVGLLDEIASSHTLSHAKKKQLLKKVKSIMLVTIVTQIM